MLQVIPWSNYTWRTRVKACRDRIDALNVETGKATEELVKAEEELAQAEQFGIADENMPDDYGETPVYRHWKSIKKE